jgi:hypothetical protein
MVSGRGKGIFSLSASRRAMNTLPATLPRSDAGVAGALGVISMPFHPDLFLAQLQDAIFRHYTADVGQRINQ